MILQNCVTWFDPSDMYFPKKCMKYPIYNPSQGNILVGEDQSLMPIREKNIVARWAEPESSWAVALTTCYGHFVFYYLCKL